MEWGDGAGQRGLRLLERLLRWGVEGFGPLKSAQEAAAEARAGGRSADEAVRALIRRHVVMAGGQGFVTNLGGLVTLPVALPANVGAGYLVQTHLVASIAAVHGHELDSEEVRAAIMVCLLGNAGAEVLKQAGVRVGTRLTVELVQRIPAALIRDINKRVGFTLLAKYGGTRAGITLAKGVPLVGGLVGGGIDAAATKAVGEFARRFFAPPHAGGMVVEGEVLGSRPADR